MSAMEEEDTRREDYVQGKRIVGEAYIGKGQGNETRHAVVQRLGFASVIIIFLHDTRGYFTRMDLYFTGFLPGQCS